MGILVLGQFEISLAPRFSEVTKVNQGIFGAVLTASTKTVETIGLFPFVFTTSVKRGANGISNQGERL